jgi:hypothetical protein
LAYENCAYRHILYINSPRKSSDNAQDMDSH